jgi:hypothetical protein
MSLQLWSELIKKRILIILPDHLLAGEDLEEIKEEPLKK